MKYFEKLRDPRWQKKRLAVMDRDAFTCLCCGSTTATLNVHHLRYSGEPWEAPLENLETLCESCHAERTAINKTLSDMPSKLVKAAGPAAIVNAAGEIGLVLFVTDRGQIAAVPLLTDYSPEHETFMNIIRANGGVKAPLKAYLISIGRHHG